MSFNPMERRSGSDRRESLWASLLAGHFLQRRKGGRRAEDAHPVARDRHAAHWLAAAVLVLALSITDAFLTLTLINQHGAQEINPFMAPLVHGDSPAFAWWKLGLTAFGVIVLIQFAHVRLFGLIPAGALLYAALLGYLALISYEWHLIHLDGPESSVVSSGVFHPVN
jgi:hypothetical protein